MVRALGRCNEEDGMSCQPAARTPKPLSHRLKQGSRAVKHTPADNPKQLQMRLTSLLRGKQTCVWGSHVDLSEEFHQQSDVALHMRNTRYYQIELNDLAY